MAPVFFCFLLMLPAFHVWAQEQAATEQASAQIDWRSGSLMLQVSSPASNQRYNRPAALFSAQRSIDQGMDKLLFQALLDIQVDSSHRLADLARQDRALFRSVEDLSSQSTLISVEPQRQLDRVSSTYRFDIYPQVSSLLVRHSSSFPMEEVLSWQPGNEYSGIVIYAGGSLPVHGENQSASLVPSLFPVIYDEDMRLLVDKNRMDPEFASRWGGAAFTDNFDEGPYQERIGENPLRIVATGLFGLVPADPLIPKSFADQLLHSQQNRQLLREGRILIIYSP